MLFMIMNAPSFIGFGVFNKNTKYYNNKTQLHLIKENILVQLRAGGIESSLFCEIGNTNFKYFSKSLIII